MNVKKSGADESDKIVKLTKVVGTKSKEITDLKTENNSLKDLNQEKTKKKNEISSRETALEVKNTRLETQIENLIEAIGKSSNNVRHNRSETEDSSEANEKEETTAFERRASVKCRHNDKAICLRKEDCQYLHHKLVCFNFSKYGTCENEQTCPRRHPSGICNRWKRGVCDKEMECFYRHPLEEEASGPRKRTLSNQQMFQNDKNQRMSEQSPRKQEEHFLFQKMMDLEKKYQSLEEKGRERKK